MEEAVRKEEQVVSGMQELFGRYGYRRFEMSKFEEYDFYAENRSFLNCESILTFTGPDGKLLAMKPDVTLSIVKNTRGSREAASRIYYHEKVYRVGRDTGEYKEIPQAGAEYIGEVDTYATLEILLLALQSLELVDGQYILDLSHVGFVAGLLQETGLGQGKQKQLLRCIQEKNAHGIRGICEREGAAPGLAGRLAAASQLYGELGDMLPAAKELCCCRRMEEAVRELSELHRCLEECGYGGQVNLDFSIVNDMDYYNGVIFQGFVNGVPEGVLSGGRYDNLVHKLGKNAGAIGFAVYLDFLERFRQERREYDVDVLLLYGNGADAAAVAKKAKAIVDGGESVAVRKADTGDIRYRRKLWMEKGGRLEDAGLDEHRAAERQAR